MDSRKRPGRTNRPRSSNTTLPPSFTNINRCSSRVGFKWEEGGAWGAGCGGWWAVASLMLISWDSMGWHGWRDGGKGKRGEDLLFNGAGDSAADGWGRVSMVSFELGGGMGRTEFCYVLVWELLVSVNVTENCLEMARMSIPWNTILLVSC